MVRKLSDQVGGPPPGPGGTTGTRTMKRTGVLVAAAAAAALAFPAQAHAAAVACGGGVSTQNIGARGCISAERRVRPVQQILRLHLARTTGTRRPTRPATARPVVDVAHRLPGGHSRLRGASRVRPCRRWIRMPPRPG